MPSVRQGHAYVDVDMDEGLFKIRQPAFNPCTILRWNTNKKYRTSKGFVVLPAEILIWSQSTSSKWAHRTPILQMPHLESTVNQERMCLSTQISPWYRVSTLLNLSFRFFSLQIADSQSPIVDSKTAWGEHETIPADVNQWLSSMLHFLLLWDQILLAACWIRQTWNLFTESHNWSQHRNPCLIFGNGRASDKFTWWSYECSDVN